MQMPMKSKFLVIFIFAIIIALIPRSFTRTSETEAMAIVTALGIDKLDDQIEVSAQIIVTKAQAGTSRSLMSVSAKGEDILAGLEDISTYIGKNIGVEHCDAIILGKEIAESGVEDVLDYFFRGNKIEHNTLLIFFNGRAKDLIESTAKIDNNFSLTIDEITKFSGEYFYTLETTLEEFFSEQYSDNKFSALGGLKITNDEFGLKLEDNQGGGSSGSDGGGSGGGSSGGGGNENKYLVNDGETAVFKDWKLAKILNHDQTMAMNWFIPKAKKSSFKVENVNDDLYEGADVVFTILNKSSNYSTKFVGDIPVLDFNIDIDLKIDNIIGGNKQNFKNINKNIFTPMLKSKIVGEVIKQTDQIMEIIKNDKLDMIKLYDKFEKHNYRKLCEVVEKNGIDYFYKNLISNVNVTIGKHL